MLTQYGRVWLSQLDEQTLLRLLSVPRRLRWQLSYRRRLASIGKLVPNILPKILALTDTPPSTIWSIQRLVQTVNDVTVVTLGPTGRPPAVVLKLAQTNQAVMSLRQQRIVLADLRADPRLGEWGALLPELLAEGEIAGQFYVVEQMLPGLEARSVLSNPAALTRVRTAAVAAIGELHRHTGISVVVDEGRLKRWVDEPLCLLRHLITIRPHTASHENAIVRLSNELYTALTGRTLFLSWIHGDFTPGNILVTPDGAAVTGIVDWDLAVPDHLPQLDLLQLMLSTRMLVQCCELGDVIRRLLDRGEWTPGEAELFEMAQSALPGDAIGIRATVLLCWLHHVAANLTKSTRYAGHWLWVSKNIDTVLRCV